MATIDDIGTDLQPLNAPSLPAWAAAVRDAITANEAAIGALAPRTGFVVPVAGWVDLGGSYAGTIVTRVGPLVTVEFMIKPTANVAFTAGSPVTVANLPAGFWPTHDVPVPALITPGAAATVHVARATLYAANGAVLIISPTTETVTAASGWVSVTATFRGAGT